MPSSPPHTESVGEDPEVAGHAPGRWVDWRRREVANAAADVEVHQRRETPRAETLAAAGSTPTSLSTVAAHATLLAGARSGETYVMGSVVNAGNITSLEHRDERGRTAVHLHVSAGFGHVEVLKFLIKEGLAAEQTNGAGIFRTFFRDTANGIIIV